MLIKDWLSNTVKLRLMSADPQALLNNLAQKGIVIKSICWIDDITVDITVPKHAYKSILNIKKKFQCELIVQDIRGLYCLIIKVSRRLLLVAGLIFFLILSFYIQNHILFIDISGNSVIPEQEIILNTENCGLRFGARRRDVRNEQIKNMLLENIPQLQWVGINTAGCVATISVRERTETEPKTESEKTPASIIASRDGTVCGVTASKGTILCQIGEKVTAGQTLISGTNSCGEIMLMTRAQGEVFAYTERNLNIKTIPAIAHRSAVQASDTRIRIIFGKNLINLFNYSGILDGSCVKIGTRYNIRLPNGFILPVGLYREHIISYSTKEQEWDPNQYQWLLQQGTDYVLNQMIAGEIVKADSEIYTDQNLMEYRINYSCKEMIGQIKKEELFCLYGKNS